MSMLGDKEDWSDYENNDPIKLERIEGYQIGFDAGYKTGKQAGKEEAEHNIQMPSHPMNELDVIEKLLQEKDPTLMAYLDKEHREGYNKGSEKGKQLVMWRWRKSTDRLMSIINRLIEENEDLMEYLKEHEQ